MTASDNSSSPRTTSTSQRSVFKPLIVFVGLLVDLLLALALVSVLITSFDPSSYLASQYAWLIALPGLLAYLVFIKLDIFKKTKVNQESMEKDTSPSSIEKDS